MTFPALRVFTIVGLKRKKQLLKTDSVTLSKPLYVNSPRLLILKSDSPDPPPGWEVPCALQASVLL